MYESYTFDFILNRMLDRVSDDIDKREGSVIYDALAPAAAELAQMYIELDINYGLSFADTASGEYLSRRTAEFGVNRKTATYAIRRGEFFGGSKAPIDVPLNSRYAIGDLTYAVTSKVGTGVFELTCEKAGSEGNQQFGALLPIGYVAGLASAMLSDVLIPGEDEETDESLRERYYETVNEPSFGGNIADYKRTISAIDGVGAVKVYPVWNGGGTVKAAIIAADWNEPSPTLIDQVQTSVDPAINRGQGLGTAPIGHQVTITGVQSLTINVGTTLTLAAGTTPGQVQGPIEDAIETYLLSLRQSWASQTQLVVRVALIDAAVLTVQGVLDVTGTTLNGSAANITLGDDEIPQLGTVTVNV